MKFRWCNGIRALRFYFDTLIRSSNCAYTSLKFLHRFIESFTFILLICLDHRVKIVIFIVTKVFCSQNRFILNDLYSILFNSSITSIHNNYLLLVQLISSQPVSYIRILYRSGQSCFLTYNQIK